MSDVWNDDEENYAYGLEGENRERPTIVLMGQKRFGRHQWVYDSLNIDCRSGKTSIRKVVFNKMSPNETLFVESTAKVTKDSKSTFLSAFS